MKTKDLVIQEPHKKSSKGIIIALAYITVIAASIYAIIFIAPQPGVNMAIVYLYITWGFGFLFLFTYQYIIRHRVKLNFTQRKVRHIYALGILRFKRKWKKLTSPKYISVFKTNDSYELNIWDEQNSVSNIVTLNDYKEAFKKAFFIASKLNIDVLDATHKGNFKLINKDAFQA